MRWGDEHATHISTGGILVEPTAALIRLLSLPFLPWSLYR